MNFEPQNGLTLGAAEQSFLPQHYVHKHSHGTPYTISKLAIELEWVSQEFRDSTSSSDNSGGEGEVRGASIRSPIVRGAPYTTMKYYNATPRLFLERSLVGRVLVDGDGKDKYGKALKEGHEGGGGGTVLECGSKYGEYSHTPVLVRRELKIQFDTSDFTWLVFVSEPTLFECTNHVHDFSQDTPLPPGIPPTSDVLGGSYFDLRATRPMRRGMVRIAMSNNCTMGQNPQRT
jgi:hypothetical protein